ncbi:MAG: hypothetical protein MRY83_25000, partial [Flavobacteriales bacterium]|nr:hypothetical protein [Flavobacteriales bacterium]
FADGNGSLSENQQQFYWDNNNSTLNIGWADSLNAIFGPDPGYATREFASGAGIMKLSGEHTTARFYNSYSNNNGGVPRNVFRRFRGHPTAPSGLVAGDDLLEIQIHGADANGANRVSWFHEYDVTGLTPVNGYPVANFELRARDINDESTTFGDLVREISSEGLFRYNKYAQGNFTGAALSKTESNFVLGLATDGTILEIDRSSLDNQNIDSVKLNGNTLEVFIENGDSASVDLSALLGSDNQNLDSAKLNGTILELFIEDGDSTSVDLSSLVNDNDWTTDGDTLYSYTDSTVVIKNSKFGLGNIDPQYRFDMAFSSNELFFRANSGVRSLTITGPDVNVSTTPFIFNTNNNYLFRTDNVNRFSIYETNGIGVGPMYPPLALIHARPAGSDPHPLLLIEDVNANTKLLLNDTGLLDLPSYGADTMTGVPSTIASFDADGDVIEMDFSELSDSVANYLANDADWTLDGDTLYSGPDSTVVIRNSRLGVGTLTPSTQLHVFDGTAGNVATFQGNLGTINMIGGNEINIAGGVSWWNQEELGLRNNTGSVQIGQRGDTGNSDLELRAGVNGSGTSFADIIFANGLVGQGIVKELGRFEGQSGNFGIGTSQPQKELQVIGSAQFGRNGGNHYNKVYINDSITTDRSAIIEVTTTSNLNRPMSGVLVNPKHTNSGAITAFKADLPYVVFSNAQNYGFFINDTIGATANLTGVYSKVTRENGTNPKTSIGGYFSAKNDNGQALSIHADSGLVRLTDVPDSIGNEFLVRTASGDIYKRSLTSIADSLEDGDWTLDGTTLYSAPDSTVVIRSGNVGIGTINPAYKLETAGEARIDRLLIEYIGQSNIPRIKSIQAARPVEVGYTGVQIGGSTDILKKGSMNTSFVIANQSTSANRPMLFQTGNGTGNPEVTRFSIGSSNNPGGNDAPISFINVSGLSIGTSTVDEMLRVEGSIKMVDGNQSNGYVMQSDANGVGTWVDPSNIVTANDSDWTIDGDSLYSTADSTVFIGNGNV